MPSRPQTFSTLGIVLKRHNIGEHDRIVTLFTREYGKLVTIAKGARKLSSTKRAHLEPGMYVKAYGVMTKSMPLLTQAQPIDAFAGCRTNLDKLKQLAQILEIIERLFVEHQAEPLLFDEVVLLLEELDSPTARRQVITQQIELIITSLGYPSLEETPHQSLSEYVAEITDKKMKSWEWLTVKS